MFSYLQLVTTTFGEIREEMLHILASCMTILRFQPAQIVLEKENRALWFGILLRAR